MDSKILGILGGGQLGRMTVEAANRLNIRTIILDAEGSPAKQINAGEHVTGQFSDPKGIAELASKADVVTIEIEHVDTEALKKVNKPVAPAAETIAIIQDKYLQKLHLLDHGVATAQSEALEPTEASLAAFGEKHGFPFMLKSRRDAYDGRGNFVVKNAATIPEALATLSNRTLYGEKWAPFTKELAVMVVRSTSGEVFAYPTVETVHKNNICHLVFAPAQVPVHVQNAAQTLAKQAVASFKGAGIFGVEMFLLPSNELLINEIAPRPHNSGHYTQDACVTSQFEAHVRACLGLPMPEGFTNLTTSTTHAIMLNVLGGEVYNSELEDCRRALETPGCAVHLYGKESRPNRKVGHINIVGNSMAECLAKLAVVQGEKPASAALPPRVGVIMGSDSDLPVMKAACKVLEDFGVPFEVSIVSAHRTPAKMVQYAESAESRGLQAIIAGAGGAAHLPGMVAASTVLPVIGVPVKGSTLDGVDSLHSIVQMPRGVPVATVAINNAMNAGLLAVRILGSSDATLRAKLQDFADKQREEVYAKDEYLRKVGHADYKWPAA